MQFPRWIPGDLVGVPSSDQRRPGRKYADVGKHWVNVCRRRQTLGERRQTPGQHDAQPWIPGDLVGVPSMDPWGPGLDAQPWIPGDLVGVPSMDPWGPGLDAQPWIPRDLVGVPSSDQRRPGQHDAIPCGPGLVGAAGRDSSAQPWIHGGQHDADVGKPGRLKESLSTVCTVPIGGDR